jgi:hypothetical protein
VCLYSSSKWALCLHLLINFNVANMECFQRVFLSHRSLGRRPRERAVCRNIFDGLWLDGRVPPESHHCPERPANTW